MPPGLTLDQLRTAVSQDRIDTVLLALTDMQGRLQGKRLDARHFLNEVRRATAPRPATTCSRWTSR